MMKFGSPTTKTTAFIPHLAIVAAMISACGSSSGNGSPVPKTEYYGNSATLSAVWANDGGEKIIRASTRGTANPAEVENTVWKDQTVNLFGAKNEVVSFNLILEAGKGSARDVAVEFSELNGPGGAKISSAPAQGDGVFDYTRRDIELFYVRYLKIQGLSKFGYEQYDERHLPKPLRRPHDGTGKANGGWKDRPEHDQEYPDIAVPIESEPTFSIAQGNNQSVWVDVYVPKNAAPGIYQGGVTITEAGTKTYVIPVELRVRGFTLPDVPNSKTMLFLGAGDIAKRYVGEENPSNSADIERVRAIRDRHFQMAHRHKISLIDHNNGENGRDRPTDEWIPRLNGSLFTSSKGYRGPGEGVGNGIFSIGTYGSWDWKDDGASGMASHANAWGNWFAQNSPGTEIFLYLIDESSDYAQIQSWATSLRTNQSQGKTLGSMATLPLPQSQANTPNLTVTTSTMDVGDRGKWESALATLRGNPSKRFYMYNGKRPASGSFMTDDEGTALREIPWGQYKKGIDRWFYWESTYYNDFQSGMGQTDVFSQAKTFGAAGSYDSVSGMTSGLYSNGDGVLFYPGTDEVYPRNSYGLAGPIASLRLKHWRRGIQDVDYLAMAAKKNPSKTQAILNSIVKSVLWENGVSDPSDPTWVRCDIGWPSDPDAWESARAKLADIIENG